MSSGSAVAISELTPDQIAAMIPNGLRSSRMSPPVELAKMSGICAPALARIASCV